MKKLYILAVALMISASGYAQTTETKYYSSDEMTSEVTPGKAKFSRTISTDANGVVTTTTNYLRKGTVTNSKTYRGDEPYGIWSFDDGHGGAELDYNFDLVYSKEVCGSDKIVKSYDFTTDDAAKGYTAPKLTGKETSYLQFISAKLMYPSYARRRGIQGAVKLTFTITKDGKIDNIVVNEGVDINLDKEAVRVIRLMRFSTPPMVNGEPKEICITTPIKFVLG